MSVYDRLILEIFRRHSGANKDEFEFDRSEMAEILEGWGKTIRNLGDVPYSYRGGRRELPDEITVTGNWIIEGRGKGRYAFRRLSRSPHITIPVDLETIHILDATPDIIRTHSGDDEQALLARVRYNRLVDTFLGVTVYHLQSHVRAYIDSIGQVEIDDLYFGVDTDGNQYVIAIEAKNVDEPLGLVQIIALNAFCQQNYPKLTAKSVAVKAWSDETFFFLEFNQAIDGDDIEVRKYRRYQLVRDSSDEHELRTRRS